MSALGQSEHAEASIRVAVRECNAVGATALVGRASI